MPEGLNSQQVQESRLKNGNNFNKKKSPFLRLIATSIFSIQSLIILIICLISVLIKNYTDAAILGVIGIVSIGFSLYQKIKAHILLNKFNKSLNQDIKVIRKINDANHIITMQVDDVVVDDIVYLVEGDQALLDGEIIKGNLSEFDESLITGESDYLIKNIGDEVLAGSVLTTGNCFYKVTKLSKYSQIKSITKSSNKYELEILKNDIGLLYIYLVYLIGFIIIAVIGYYSTLSITKGDIDIALIISSLIPQGLILVVSILFAFGAHKIFTHGGLLQNLKTVESMSRVQVLCMDKTGTLTKNMLTVKRIIWLNKDTDKNKILLATLIANISQKNRTLQAIEKYLSKVQIDKSLKKKKEVPFSSVRKLSICVFENQTLILGAPEILMPKDRNIISRIKRLGDKSYRVLLFGSLVDKQFIPEAIIALEDIIRDDIAQTFEYLAQKEIDIKILSGDSIETVTATVKKIKKDLDIKAISGIELEQLNKKMFKKKVISHNIFARVTPHQKKRIIKDLKRNGLYTAMVGDGINDELAFKEANLSIQVNSNLPTTIEKSEFKILNNSLNNIALIEHEGRKIVIYLQLITKLFVIKALTLIFLIPTSFIIGIKSYESNQFGLVSFLTIAIPTFILSIDETNSDYLKIEKNSKLLLSALKIGILNIFIFASIILFAKYTYYFNEELQSLIFYVSVLLGSANIFIIYMQFSSIKKLLENKILIATLLAIIFGYGSIISIPTLSESFNLKISNILDFTVITLVIIFIVGIYIEVTDFKRLKRHLIFLKQKMLKSFRKS